jgi:hypothetical protein
MYGPEPRGHWSGHLGPNCGSAHELLVSGRRYEVIAEFIDFDGDIHPVGETWIFLGFCFLPYDDGMSFFITTDPEYEWHIRLLWRPDQQGSVLDNIGLYVRQVS